MTEVITAKIEVSRVASHRICVCRCEISSITFNDVSHFHIVSKKSFPRNIIYTICSFYISTNTKIIIVVMIGTDGRNNNNVVVVFFMFPQFFFERCRCRSLSEFVGGAGVLLVFLKDLIFFSPEVIDAEINKELMKITEAK
jgi:hypothetical protein